MLNLMYLQDKVYVADVRVSSNNSICNAVFIKVI